ncbi:MAG: hypothetical protein A4E52_00164 [Pelotomaculum sp. PtaB.Bin013]|uniref:Uncharacterized protein n=1 Tax=Pelotomaculum isophthalicicum JI TaxID=947010 RepID=A0A9X4H474_9FIRM|nr:hypothetical protein [Pelotomaculum isophthalicicum]MDF9408523.1 hypothetical protein [Pelotomaculum isophthalicicum JI]OPX92060.1 MAG: hypothetical protein A4E52_00164 [Pelotomaculum sp. PtaB.Bin013]
MAVNKECRKSTTARPLERVFNHNPIGPGPVTTEEGLTGPGPVASSLLLFATIFTSNINNQFR